ncbi:hypothetical protein ACI6QG_13735 [Roseococcus sp. DSY-14]|uniref:hypothetical protein n=1 Tax=Roseococcus sp. DSY-14 TaxID=3369650 RepID=UPI00387B34CF
MRRRAVCAAGVAGLALPALATRSAIEVLTFEARPFAIRRGPEPGLALALVAEVLRLVGVQAVFTFLPYAYALARVGEQPGAALAPAPRLPGLGPVLDWSLPLFETPDGFATLHGPPPGSWAEALALPAVAVLEGDAPPPLPPGQLRHHASPRDIVAALREGEADAWHGSAPMQRHALGAAARLGRPLGSTARWLAQNPKGAIPGGELRDAMAALEADGSVGFLLRELDAA